MSNCEQSASLEKQYCARLLRQRGIPGSDLSPSPNRQSGRPQNEPRRNPSPSGAHVLFQGQQGNRASLHVVNAHGRGTEGNQA